ncbi:MAG TPA: response regulator, partial [Chthoniobacteraceae bacterium]
MISLTHWLEENEKNIRLSIVGYVEIAIFAQIPPGPLAFLYRLSVWSEFCFLISRMENGAVHITTPAAFSRAQSANGATWDELRAVAAGVQQAKILIIDDEEPNVRLLERLLQRVGFVHLAKTMDSRESVALFQKFQPDLVLLDLHMPHLDGFGVMAQIEELRETDEYLPIIVLTADVTANTRRRALTAGAADFLTKPFDRLEVVLRVRNVLQSRMSHLEIRRQNGTLEENVRRRTIDLESALDELEAIQQQVIQQERLAALGTMASGIAHDFNNALSVIMGFGEILLRESAEGLSAADAAGSLRTILTAADDASKIVHRLREFYRPSGADEPQVPLCLNLLAEQALTLTKPRWQTLPLAAGRKIDVVQETRAQSEIAGNPAELREVLTNLIFNAVDAMPEGGVITIKTWSGAEGVTLQVKDTGTGMSEEVRRRCLEPFFTTKGERGTGLGLAMVYGIIERHKGTIELESAPGEGTSFTFRFPAYVGSADVQVSEHRRFEQPLRILVAEDQPILCELFTECLTADCHLVETALDGKTALEKFQNGVFDLVITDHSMPGMSGLQLAAAIKASA